MRKRVIVLYCAIVFSLGGLVFRFASIITNDYAESAARSNTRSITVDTSRGIIYDCNMKPITNSAPKYYLAVKPTSAALAGLNGILSEEQFKKLSKNLSAGMPTLISLDHEIKETKDTRVIKIMGRYSKDQLASHIVGYLDNAGKGTSGLEKSFNKYLEKNSGALRAGFTIDALGRLLPGSDIEIQDSEYTKSQGLMLTIDSKVQEISEKAIDNSSIECGCVVVVEVGTGEIKAMASRPTFDANNLGESLHDQNSPFINRCITQYTVGSSFKAIVAASAIENDNISPTTRYTCTGSTKRSGTTFSCFDKNGHGDVDMQQALSKSCNTYFIDLANKINMPKLIKMANNMGFARGVTLAEGMEANEGNLPLASSLNSEAAIANFAFGQGDLLATPLQMASAFATIAADGYYTQPFIVKALVDENGKLTKQYKSTSGNRAMAKVTAKQVTSMLKTVVDENERAKPINTTACGKTATAQSGWYQNGVEVCHSWFVGYFPAEKPRYAVAVMKEFGTSGSGDCAPVFKEISEKVTALNS
ncbi:MAG: penicillin-binding protein 2 [Oscillospiraceae bacterium]